MPKKCKRRVNVIPPETQSLSISLSGIYDENYPLFCFKHLSEISISKCTDHKFFYNFLMRLRKLSQLGWKGIRESGRHSFGMEPIPVTQIKPKLPECITPDVKYLHVLRAAGNNLPFIGIQIDRVFRVLFIEAKFGDIYDH